VVLEVGKWHALSVCAVLSDHQGKVQSYKANLTEAHTTAILELEVLWSAHLYASAAAGAR
jgi:hypothetical protein